MTSFLYMHNFPGTVVIPLNYVQTCSNSFQHSTYGISGSHSIPAYFIYIGLLDIRRALDPEWIHNQVQGW